MPLDFREEFRPSYKRNKTSAMGFPFREVVKVKRSEWKGLEIVPSSRKAGDRNRVR
jgi:hypothetical protein